jgi:hypothetical protein
MFNLFTIPLRKIRARAFVTDINNQLAWKCIQKTCHMLFGLDVADRIVVNAFYVKLTEDQVRISLKRTFMYFPWFFNPLKWIFRKGIMNKLKICIEMCHKHIHTHTYIYILIVRNRTKPIDISHVSLCSSIKQF